MKLYDKKISEVEENGKKITLLSLCIPLLLESILLQFYSTANTFILKGYSENAVTAVAIGESIISIASVIILMAVKGAVILTSYSLGKKDKKTAGEVAGTAVICVGSLAILFGLIMLIFANQLVALMNLTGSIAEDSAGFLRVRAIFLIFASLMSFFNNILIANGKTKNTMVVGICSNVLNITICYILLYTGIKLPFKGIYAVAISSVVSQFLGMLASLFFLKKLKCPFAFCFKKDILKRILKLGIPGGMCNLSYSLSQTITTGFTAILGPVMVNAKVYISNIVVYTSRISIAVGNATGILMGRHRGANRIEDIRSLFKQNILIGVISNVTLSLIVFILCKPLLSLFTNSAEIFAIATPIMLIDVLVEGARAVNNVSEHSLNANGDVKATLIIAVFSTWLFSVLGTYLLGIVCGIGLIGIWLAFAMDEIFRAIVYCVRWKSGKWQKARL